MSRLILTAAFVAAACAGAGAAERYDRSIERAAMQIVAAKIDGLRGGFAFDEAPQIISSYAALVAATEPAGVWQDGLARAAERRYQPLQTF